MPLLPLLLAGTRGGYEAFPQILDHFDTHLSDTFIQRYYVDPSTVTNASSSVLLLLGGLRALEPTDALRLSDFAREAGSVLVGLEHRYFGESRPRAAPLAFLSVEQALADADWFLTVMDWSLYLAERRPRVVAIGGGYAGSLAAWFRLRFPQQAAGAWASSAPLRLVAELPAVDREIAAGIQRESPQCLNVTRALLAQAHRAVAAGGPAVPELKRMFDFDADQDDVSFLYVIAEAIGALFTHRGAPPVTRYCDALLGDPRLEALSRAIDDILAQIEETPKSLDPLFNFFEDDHMSQWWLACTQLGWFPTHAPDGLRSPWINISYFTRVCRAKFGIMTNPLLNPFGGARPSVSSVFFTIGASDPYRSINVAPEVASEAQELTRAVIGHPAMISADLYLADHPPANASEIRARCLNVVQAWVQDACSSKCRNVNEGRCVFQQCVCNDGWAGTNCERRMQSLTAFRFLTILCIAVPTVFLVLLSLAVWFCGASDDDPKGQQRLDRER
jgi:hypothetical protein